MVCIYHFSHLGQVDPCHKKKEEDAEEEKQDKIPP
jgi:hypothetical protein